MAITLSVLTDFQNSFTAESQLNFQQNPYNTSHHTFNVLPHYLAKIEFEFWKIWRRTTSRAGNACFHSTGSVATEQSWPQTLSTRPTRCGASSSSKSTCRGCITLMNWIGMALTRPSLTMQLTSGVDVFAHVCGEKGWNFEQLLWQYSATWQETF